MNREVQGELVRFIRPPVTGRSASFRLRFRFVRAVRAGEAKLCGRMWDVVLVAGPAGCWDPRVFRSAALGVNLLCAGMWVLTAFDRYSSRWD